MRWFGQLSLRCRCSPAALGADMGVCGSRRRPGAASPRPLLVRGTGLTLALAASLWASACAGYGEFLRDKAELVPTDGKMEGQDQFGSWQFQVEQCTSGAREGFYGATFYSNDRRHAVRIIKNPVGPLTVALAAPGQVEFFAEVACRAVVGSFENHSNVRINGVPVISGRVQLVCDGVRGSAIFTCS